MTMVGDIDRISDLPDNLLHSILVRLPCAAAAACTSVLSQRWRHVWAHIPALSFIGEPSASTLDALDTALSAYSAPWLNRLSIAFYDMSPGVPTARANAWLRFASQRLAGELALHLSLDSDIHELELPVCERVTTIDIFITKTHDRRRKYLFKRHPLLRLPQSGTFAALCVLKIEYARLVCDEIGRVVSEQSPCLRKLDLHYVSGVHGICICSGSLEQIVLRFASTIDRLNIAAPRLFYLELSSCCIGSASIVAPALSKLIWDCKYKDNCARSTDITVADCCLAKLETCSYQAWSMMPFLQRFDVVDDLCLWILYRFSITNMDNYNIFIEETYRLPRAKILRVLGLQGDSLGFAAMLHLLRKCNGLHLKKLKIAMLSMYDGDGHMCTSACTCLPVESWRMNNITLGSLQELEIDYFNNVEHFCAFLEILFIGCKLCPKRLVIYPLRTKPLTGFLQMRIQRLAYPCTNIEFMDSIP